VLPQDALLPANDKVGEFLVDMARLQGIGARQATQHAKDALQEVDGSTWWGMRCGALSHGMAKRVQLAQALLGDPKVVLLDEPTGGLDPRAAHEVRTLVKARRGRCTLVISSHNLQELEEVCSSAAILDRGRLVMTGTMAELTAVSSEIRIELARGSGPTEGGYRTAATSPEEALRAVAGVTTVGWHARTRELAVTFDRAACDAEEMIRNIMAGKQRTV